MNQQDKNEIKSLIRFLQRVADRKKQKNIDTTSSITGQRAHVMWFDDLEYVREYKYRKEAESHDITKSDFGVTKNWWNNG